MTWACARRSMCWPSASANGAWPGDVRADTSAWGNKTFDEGAFCGVIAWCDTWCKLGFTVERFIIIVRITETGHSVVYITYSHLVLDLFSGNSQWAHHCSTSLGWRVRPSPLKCKDVYVVFALGKESTFSAVVSSIVRVFHWLKSQGDGSWAPVINYLFSVVTVFLVISYLFPV